MLYFPKEEMKVMRMRWLELSIKNVVTDKGTRSIKMGMLNLDYGKLRKELQGQTYFK